MGNSPCLLQKVLLLGCNCLATDKDLLATLAATNLFRDVTTAFRSNEGVAAIGALSLI
jgi:hypothetical protein